MARITLPAIKQPSAANDIVGFNLQNATAADIPAQYVTFQQTFLPGKVSSTDGITANGLPAQMDVKTTHGDGSVRSALITFKHGILPANSMTQFMLAKDAGLTGTPPTFSGADLKVKIGTTTFDAATMFAGSVSYWQKGPLVTQGRVSAPVSGSLRLTIDLTAYVDGSTAADVQFNNDAAMQASGNTQSYTAVITWNGAQVLSQAVTHYQYQTWHKVLGGSPANVVLDIAYLIKTGALPNLNLAAGADSGEIKQVTNAGPLQPGSVQQYMPNVGGRPDIGLMPTWNAVWLLTQDPQAAKYALAQADVAGSVPWHFFDPTKGAYVSLTDYPTLWTDPRGTPTLKQPVKEPKWTAERAHMPDLSYVPYLLTGRRYYLDQLNAQATFAEMDTWNAYRDDGNGLVANGSDQVRAQAWGLRLLNEAAWINPTGSPDQIYWKKLADGNWKWLVSQIPTWTQGQGQPYGRVPGEYRDDVAPWQQDYFSSVSVQAVLMGSADALTFLKWQMNFLVGRFQNAANGFNPQNGVAYALTMEGLKTWAQVGAANGGSGWPDGNYAEIAAMSLAGIIRVTGSADAQTAYNWLMSSDAPYIKPYFQEAQFGVVPGTVAPPPPPPPPPPVNATLSISASATKNEGNSGTTNFDFAVTRGGGTTIAASANWAVTGSGSNPAAASDFVGGVFPSGTVNFAVGETSKVISVPVAGDTIVEPNESFTVTLSNPSANTTITTASATGTITNDDAAPPPPPPPPTKHTVSVVGDNASATLTDTNIVVTVDGVKVWP